MKTKNDKLFRYFAKGYISLIAIIMMCLVLIKLTIAVYGLYLLLK